METQAEVTVTDSGLEEAQQVIKPLTDLGNPDYYINRELSHLQFNIRVLEQALNEEYPLLERLRFLLIFSSNMDEFFEIRVAGLMEQIEFGREYIDLGGMKPTDVLNEISRLTHEQVEKQYQILNEQLLPALAKENIRFLRRSQLDEQQIAWVHHFFYQQIMPIVSPIGLDPAHPFPRLANKSLNFIVELDGQDAFGRETGMAVIPAPRSLPRVVKLPDEVCKGGDNYVFLSSIIHQHAEDLFPGMKVKGCYQFRITRNSDLSLEEEVDDLALALKGELQSRRYGEEVRLEIVDNCPKPLTDFLLKKFGLSENELYSVNGPVNLTRMMDVCNMPDRSDLQHRAFTPGFPKELLTKRGKLSDHVLEAVKKNDILLMHPFQSFTPVVDMLRQAAKDPDVLAIKQTLYRTGARSEIVNALVEAARNGKEVIVVVEIRARFDEEENLILAQRLQEAGAIVVYGVVSFKTHSKMMLIVRREGRKIQRYAHLGTGNYHAGNARLYTDYSLLSCDRDLTNDVHKLFQQLTGMGKALRVKKLFHAPFTLKKKLVDLINHEIAMAKEGKPAKIIIKCNSLTEPVVIRALYKASQAGVEVDMVVRGICCLRPGIPGLSENIRVRSVVGRLLEHTRVFYFENGGDFRVFGSSADWMVRNLDMRIETCFPIEDPKLALRVKKELEGYLRDNCRSWELLPDGSYERIKPRRGQRRHNAQDRLLEQLAANY
ncbi:polyphosphate kinase 1 [Spongorhabdus nitratireducens]